MKNLIVSLLFLSALVMWFSLCGENIPHDYSFGNWAFPGQSGEPIPGEGEDGDTKAFTLAEPKVEPEQQKTLIETEQEFPITVSIERPIESKTPVWEYILYGAAITLATEVTALLVIAIVFWLKSVLRS